MSELPRDRSLDSTLALLSEGYRFISDRCRRLRSDVFETRLMLRRAVCISGEEAARVFYEPGRFTRQGALPPTVLLLLQDRGSVATLDGEAHRRRKAMFMSLMTPASIAGLVAETEALWRGRIPAWERMENLALLPAVEEILCQAVCRWAGIPLENSGLRRRTRELVAMFDGAGAIGPRNWRGMLLRARNERWMRDIVARLRDGALEAPEGSAARLFAGAEGELPDRTHAAVELLNLLRPTVAVSRYIVFLALALHEYPACRERLREGGEEYLEWFVQEVRRFYPFFPAVAGRVLQPFEWRGHRFGRRDWVLLDIYGTNRDERSWKDPEAFRPERFSGRSGSAFDLIPQGGGDRYSGHRCAGEWATIALMKGAARLLTRSMRYEVVPDQDLRVDLSRMPARPRSGFVIGKVKAVSSAGQFSGQAA
jgi:fatty-acid peroxygenase